MNYQKIYDDVIERAKSRWFSGYCEHHHILPKCMGGIETVQVTAREHFILHMLLVRIDPNNSKLHYGLWRLINSKGKQGYKVSARTYETLKIEHSKQISVLMKKINSGKNNPMYGISSPMKDKHHTKESRKKYQKV